MQIPNDQNMPFPTHNPEFLVENDREFGLKDSSVIWCGGSRRIRTGKPPSVRSSEQVQYVVPNGTKVLK